MELWDLIDRDGNPLGMTHLRGRILPEGTYHRTVEIFTVNSQSELLVTLRDPNKDIYPNLWEFTGGSVVAGEDSLSGAIRELREETGIQATADEMIFLKTSVSKTSLNNMYMTFKDVKISDIKFQAGETVDAKWVTFAEFESMIDEGIVAEPVCIRYNEAKELLQEKISARKI